MSHSAICAARMPGLIASLLLTAFLTIQPAAAGYSSDATEEPNCVWSAQGRQLQGRIHGFLDSQSDRLNHLPADSAQARAVFSEIRQTITRYNQETRQTRGYCEADAVAFWMLDNDIKIREYSLDAAAKNTTPWSLIAVRYNLGGDALSATDALMVFSDQVGCETQLKALVTKAVGAGDERLTDHILLNNNGSGITEAECVGPGVAQHFTPKETLRALYARHEKE